MTSDAVQVRLTLYSCLTTSCINVAVIGQWLFKKISMLEIMLYETRYDDHSVLKKKDPSAAK